MVGIYDCFGYDVSFRERYRLIKEAGFDSVMLWWSDRFGRGEGYQNDVQYARDAGLIIENIHTPVHQQNCISLDNQDGENVLQNYLQCVKDCDKYTISTMVIHLPDDRYLINKLGMKRIKTIIVKAEEYSVNVAFENLNNIQNLTLVMDTIHSNNVGYCYDSCHHINYAPDIDLLGKYGERLIALHLQDNGGVRNQHQLPFDGTIDWENVMKRILATGYKGATTLEPMNWDYKDISIQEFLSRAYQKAKKLDEMRNISI